MVRLERRHTIAGGALAAFLACCGEPPTTDRPTPVTLAPDGTFGCRADAARDPTLRNADLRPWPGLDSATPEAIVPARCLPEDDRPLSMLQNRERACRTELTDPARVRVKPPIPHLPYLDLVLDVLEEPSIACGSPPEAQLYRLTWNAPLLGYASLRLEVLGDEGLLIAKAWPVDRSGEAPDESLSSRRRITYAMGARQLTAQELTNLRSAIASGGFWDTDDLPFEQEDLPTDLRSWTLEGSRAGTYHFLQGWDGLSDVRGCGLCRHLSATLASLLGPLKAGAGPMAGSPEAAHDP